MIENSSILAGLHVIVVEDEYILAFQTADDLRAVGAIPLGPVPDVTGALKLIANEPKIDAAILNVRLRGDLSFPVADELLRRGIPFVFVTGNVDTVRQYDVPIHPKPAKMASVAKSLASLVKAKTSNEVVPVP